MSQVTFEDAIREYEEAGRVFNTAVRKWLTEQEPAPKTEDDFKALGACLRDHALGRSQRA